MRSSIIKISIVLILITSLIVSIAIYFNKDNKNFKIEADCGMEDGPIYGKKIYTNLLTMVVDINIPIKGGKLIICNTPADDLELDSLAPVLYKVDSNYQVLWAVELVSNDAVKLYSIEDCRLFGHELHFFNSTHLEPGVIYLDKNFDFKYMCLSMF